MKKLILLSGIVIASSIFAMENDKQENSSGKSLENMPPEIIFEIAASSNSDFEDIIKILQSLEKTNKNLKKLVYAPTIKTMLTKLVDQEMKIEVSRDFRFHNWEKILNLVDYGADINIQDKNGYTALLFAIDERWCNDVVEKLICNGANVNISNKWGISPLMVSVFYDNIKQAEE